MSKREKLSVVFEFQNGEKVVCSDISKPSQKVVNSVADWILGMKSNRPRSALELLRAISRKPRTPDELNNPGVIAKMQLVGWIQFDPQERLWSITPKGKLALQAKP